MKRIFHVGPFAQIRGCREKSQADNESRMVTRKRTEEKGSRNVDNLRLALGGGGHNAVSPWVDKFSTCTLDENPWLHAVVHALDS